MTHRRWILAPVLFAALTACAPSTSPPAAHRTPPTPPAPAPTTRVAYVPPEPPAVEPLAAPVEQPGEAAREAAARAAAPADGAPDATAARGSMWGGEVGTSYGAGGLGLSGIGEGGGGRGEGIGLGRVGPLGHGAGTGTGMGFGSGHGRIGPSHVSKPSAIRMGAVTAGGAAAGTLPAPSVIQPQPEGVRTGEWDDNANFREYLRWIGVERAPGAARFDLSVRRFLVVRDAAGKAVPSCPIDVVDGHGNAVTLTTTASGRALLFPRAEGLSDADLVATARCQGLSAVAPFRVAPGDGAVDIQLPVQRVLPQAQTIDVAFVLDTTGSMSEEIGALRDTLEKVAAQLAALNVRPRVGLVEYRDKGDVYITRLHQMTTDVQGLSARIAQIRADGGGDTPEHVNEALRVAVRGLRFRPESIARLVFLIGDAPPHLDYAQDEGYAPATREANHAGIQLFTIAASGMDDVGQVVWRQMAQYTGGTHMFVLRGGAGPQSTGGGDPRDSCGGTHGDYRSGNLDALILAKVQAALAARDADPMRIAGLHRDEKDVPCNQRVVMAL